MWQTRREGDSIDAILGRRTVLAGTGTLPVVLTAGCIGGPDGGGTGSDGDGGDAPQGGGGDGDGMGANGGDDLDLREANVTGVTIDGGDGSYRVSVTLIHDDDGEDGFANWWQVETLDGERLGRRDLAHAHGTREFTRSTTVSVPDDVTCVVVRGHDETHGYGGQAMLVNLDSTATRAIRQGSDRQSFAQSRCP